MFQKGLSPIVVVLLIVLGIGGYLIYQNQNKTTPTQETTQSSVTQSDKTANWKVYTNTVQGYSVRYPLDWFVQSTGSETLNGKFVSITNYDSALLKTAPPARDIVSIAIVIPSVSTEKDQSIEEFYKKMIEDNNFGKVNYKSSQTKIAGSDALKIMPSEGSSILTSYLVRVPNKNYILEIALLPPSRVTPSPSPTDSEITYIFEQIASSLNFNN